MLPSAAEGVQHFLLAIDRTNWKLFNRKEGPYRKQSSSIDADANKPQGTGPSRSLISVRLPANSPNRTADPTDHHPTDPPDDSDGLCRAEAARSWVVFACRGATASRRSVVLLRPWEPPRHQCSATHWTIGEVRSCAGFRMPAMTRPATRSEAGVGKRQGTKSREVGGHRRCRGSMGI